VTFLEDLIERFGGGEEAQDTLRDLAKHGAEGGFPGITYYTDTVAMYEAHTDEIWDALYEDSEGTGGIPAFIAGLGGAEHVGSQTQFANLLVWYMAERVAGETTNV
jgi:hypothetical protein